MTQPPSPAPTAQPGAPAEDGSPTVSLPISRRDIKVLGATRELFWQNMMQEMLLGLAALSQEQQDAEIFDGRLAIITRLGHRIPIGSVSPIFACGVTETQDSRDLSVGVECTIYQIITPSGEVYTLPLHEISMFHTLTEALVEQVKSAAVKAQAERAGEEQPFGFAAFTSLARQRGTVPPGRFIGPAFPLD
ncbi:MAG: hypothetical protein KF864_09245 [Phycisphaeraceae bacterium]|nr:hypothetical protein [Phycisphaeraceae bacterium]